MAAIFRIANPKLNPAATLQKPPNSARSSDLFSDFYFLRLVFDRDGERAAASAFLQTIEERPLPFHRGVIDFWTLVIV